MPPSAISPFVTTYAQDTPYITVDEFLAAPTALDVTDLIQDGTAAQQTQALADQINRATAWVNQICNQVLSATYNVERSRYRVNRRGYVSVPLSYKPVLEIDSIKFGARPSLMTTLADFSDVQVNRCSVDIPVFPVANGVNTIGLGGWGIGSRLLVEVGYVNGWCNALLTAPANAGATSLVIAPSIGIYPGSQLRISDTVNSEVVTIASSYVPAASTIPLTAPIVYTHAAGVSISNLPVEVKQATILLTAVLIQTRGNDAIILDSVENPGRLSDSYGASGSSIAIAKDMLLDLTRVW